MYLVANITGLEFSFSALTLLVGRQKGHPACKKLEWWGAGVVICLERGADLHMAQLMPLPLTVSCFSKIQIGLPFWYRLTRVQWRRQDSVTGGSVVWVYRGSRVRSPPVPVVLSVYQRGSLLDGLVV